MKILVVLILLTTAYMAPPNTALASGCGEPPLQVAQNVAVETERVTSGLLGLDKVTIKNRVEQNVQNLLAPIPNSGYAVVSLGILYVTCKTLENSHASAKEKLFALCTITKQIMHGVKNYDECGMYGNKVNTKLSHDELLFSFVSLNEMNRMPECVPFLFNKSDPEFAKLNKYYILHLAQDIISSGKHIVIVGYVFESGVDGQLVSREYALGWSMRRAEAVKSYLVDAGIPATEIATIGRGRDGIVVPVGKLYCGAIVSSP